MNEEIFEDMCYLMALLVKEIAPEYHLNEMKEILVDYLQDKDGLGEEDIKAMAFLIKKTAGMPDSEETH